MPTTLVFGLDYTVYAYLFKHSLDPNLPSHLSPFKIDNCSVPYKNFKQQLPKAIQIDAEGNCHPTFHAIYKNEMGALFRAALKANIQIVFITRSSLVPELIKPMVERLYNLPDGALTTCLYLYLGNCPELLKHCKAKFIKQEVDKGTLGANPNVIFVDNDLIDTEAARNSPYSYQTIDATGQYDLRSTPYPLFHTSTTYLLQILQKTNLFDDMPKQDQDLFTALMAKENSRPTNVLSFSRILKHPLASEKNDGDNFIDCCCNLFCRPSMRPHI